MQHVKWENICIFFKWYTNILIYTVDINALTWLFLLIQVQLTNKVKLTSFPLDKFETVVVS